LFENFGSFAVIIIGAIGSAVINAHPLMVFGALRVSNSEMTFSQGQVEDPALLAGENKGLRGDVR